MNFVILSPLQNQMLNEFEHLIYIRKDLVEVAPHITNSGQIIAVHTQREKLT